MDNADDECGVPSTEDERWWAGENKEWHDLASDENEEEIEQRAGEAEFVDAHERGLAFF